jgi:enterochelin esterase-like enzyme
VMPIEEVGEPGDGGDLGDEGDGFDPVPPLVTGAPRRATVRMLEATGQLTAHALEELVRDRELPLVEGRSCTFVYRGPAAGVRLEHWVFGLPPRPRFRRVADSDLWYLVLELPPNSRIEYKLAVTEPGGTRLIEDPLNPHRAHDPFGFNSVCQTEGYETPDWVHPDPEAREGTLRDAVVESDALGRSVPLTVYVPPRFLPSRRYPLLVVHDGGDYLSFARLKIVLDNLIHQLLVPDLVAVLHHPVDRLVEYADDPRHARFLTEELVPSMESELPLLQAPEGRCLMGASFGAVASLAAAWRYPGFWGRLLLQSGSFAFSDVGRGHRSGRLWRPVERFVNTFRESPARVSERVFVSCGIYESLIYENRSLVPRLQDTGMDVRFEEVNDGHNWEAWRDRLGEALPWLFPGPLWLVYE